MAVSAKMVRDLREMTGAGMMDCKKALEATGGDLDAAVDHLRKSGLKSAEKKAARTMGEGRVHAFIEDGGRRGSMVLLSCETDFVAKTEDVTRFLESLAAQVLEGNPASSGALLNQPWEGGGTVEEALKSLIGKLGENMSIGGYARLENREGWIGSYIHHDNRQSAMVAVTTPAPREQAEPLLKALCQHIVVYSPACVSRDEVPDEVIEREKEIYREEVQGKPENIQEKILAGKLEKYYAGIVLPEQPWIHDDKTTVAQALVAELGEGTRVKGFAHFKVGG